MAPDLIVYALVAAGLVIWLRNILGTRSGDERERPNPFARETVETKRDAVQAGVVRPSTPQEKIEQLAANPASVMAVENKTAEKGLLDLSKLDKTFDIKFFLEGAQEAFIMIVEAFARGDRETLRDLLADPVYKTFESAIAQREASGETMLTEIMAVRKTRVTAVEIQGRMAYITVLFQADETSVIKDKAGAILSGNAERAVPMRDLWTFGRDIRGRDPRWLVCQTSGDIEDDNTIIPNTNESSS